jgi:hypothetical protein
MDPLHDDRTVPAAPPPCWYEVVDHQPTMGRCPRACNGSPVASELMADRSRRTYCEAHWYWRRRDTPTAVMQRL